jgi:CHAT domain-containing protein
MSGFYKRLLTKENLSASKALRASQLEMISSGRFSSPFYWAPFVLIGDWR